MDEIVDKAVGEFNAVKSKLQFFFVGGLTRSKLLQDEVKKRFDKDKIHFLDERAGSVLAYGVAVRAAEMQGYPFNNIHESLCPISCKDRFKNLSHASYMNSILDRRQVTQEIKPRTCLRESFRFKHGKRSKIANLCPETNAMKINVPLNLYGKNRTIRTDGREDPD